MPLIALHDYHTIQRLSKSLRKTVIAHYIVMNRLIDKMMKQERENFI